LHVYLQNKFGRKLGRRCNGQLRVTLITAGIDSSFDVTPDTVLPIMRFLVVAHIFSLSRNGTSRRCKIANGNKYFLPRTSARKHCTSTANFHYWHTSRRSSCINKYRYREFERAGMTAAKIIANVIALSRFTRIT